MPSMEKSSFFEEIREEGRIEVSRRYTLEVLTFRFGPKVATQFDEAINDIRDCKRLRGLYRQALVCRRISDFRQQLEPKKRARTKK